MAVHEHVARRAILQGFLAAPAIAVLGAPVLASAETPIMVLYREHQATEALMNDTNTSSEEFDRLYIHIGEVEDQMSEIPATCLADLAAKMLALTTLRDEVSTPYDLDLRAECQAFVAGVL